MKLSTTFALLAALTSGIAIGAAATPIQDASYGSNKVDRSYAHCTISGVGEMAVRNYKQNDGSEDYSICLPQGTWRFAYKGSKKDVAVMYQYKEHQGFGFGNADFCNKPEACMEVRIDDDENRCYGFTVRPGSHVKSDFSRLVTYINNAAMIGVELGVTLQGKEFFYPVCHLEVVRP
ncbi:uncharacterized protein PFL1_02390 [Pseudozyma flocculosa PF-1]|uniref:Uncharacterized protein n=1 Tax=Pseudozyma flocculosa TaxID=84751 RepID=A0A5C3F7T5_9BASI|nr:uncharacterized protein PFL1_02390 [Pseudozyma flocculosa PF-1]EPQ30274.1 hypothetical protein PFL1_02390 [Pseudozyma flocculosa PF-1]SPO39785.1 uncharacterized protein PSFLO_05266 [Pseudozyma flocculosa]